MQIPLFDQLEIPVHTPFGLYTLLVLDQKPIDTEYGIGYRLKTVIVGSTNCIIDRKLDVSYIVRKDEDLIPCSRGQFISAWVYPELDTDHVVMETTKDGELVFKERYYYSIKYGTTFNVTEKVNGIITNKKDTE